MNKLILHIPHSSIYIPDKTGYVVSKATLDKELLKLTDWYTDDLFSVKDTIPIKAEFSRIFCDPERFADDAKEIMVQFGMGVLYTHTDDGILMRTIDDDLRFRILNNYYWIHHKVLSEAVAMQLKHHKKVLIVDCHSFPNNPLNASFYKGTERPDFNLGTDSYHTPQYLITSSVAFFKSKGYSVLVDKPYSGTIVPMEYYQKDNRVQSVMLEINRSLYLQENSSVKNEHYSTIKKIVREYLELIRKKI